MTSEWWAAFGEVDEHVHFPDGREADLDTSYARNR